MISPSSPGFFAFSIWGRHLSYQDGKTPWGRGWLWFYITNCSTGSMYYSIIKLMHPSSWQRAWWMHFYLILQDNPPPQKKKPHPNHSHKKNAVACAIWVDNHTRTTHAQGMCFCLKQPHPTWVDCFSALKWNIALYTFFLPDITRS